MRLGSEELRDEIMRRQSVDPEFQSKLKGLTFRLILLGIDAPGGQDRQLAINLQAGKFINVDVDVQPAPSPLRTAPFDHNRFDARVIAPQQTLIDLVHGNIDLATALGKVQIEGNITKLTAQAPGFIAFINFLATMDIEP